MAVEWTSIVSTTNTFMQVGVVITCSGSLSETDSMLVKVVGLLLSQLGPQLNDSNMIPLTNKLDAHSWENKRITDT